MLESSLILQSSLVDLLLYDALYSIDRVPFDVALDLMKTSLSSLVMVSTKLLVMSGEG